MEFFNRFSLTRPQPLPPQINTPAQPINKPPSSRNVSWQPTTKAALTAAGILTGLGATYFFYSSNPLPPVNVIPTPPPSTNSFEIVSTFFAIGTVLTVITACMCKSPKTSKNPNSQKEQTLPNDDGIEDEESNSSGLNATASELLDEDSTNGSSTQYRYIKKAFDNIDKYWKEGNNHEVDKFLNNPGFSSLLNKINDMADIQEITEIRNRCLALKQKYPDTKTVVLDTCSTIIEQFTKDHESEIAEDSIVEVLEKEQSDTKLLSQ